MHPDDAAGPPVVPQFRRGVRLALDVGTVRIGVASCDADGILVSPVETIHRKKSAHQGAARIAHLCSEYQPIVMYIGLPLSMDGTMGQSARSVIEYIELLIPRLADVEIRVIDERLTTVTAHRVLHEAGVSGRRQRAVVDQQAAMTMLETAISTEKLRGAFAGTSAAEVLAQRDEEL